MGGSSPDAGAFRRRAERSGGAAVFDEAVAVFQGAPLRWSILGIRHSLPFAAVAIAFVHAHRVLWVARPWEEVARGSLALSVALVLAWAVRGVGHGAVARAVVVELLPGPAPEKEPASAWTQLGLSILGGGASVALGVFALVPGLFAAGWFAPSAAVAAVEGRGLADTLVRCRELRSGTRSRTAAAVTIHLLLVVLVATNIVLGAVLLTVALGALTGIDTTVLRRFFGPGNEAFLAISVVGGFLAVEPVWALARALLYLDARLGRSGADLRERWEAIRSRDGWAASGSGASLPPGRPRDRAHPGVALLLAGLGTVAAGAWCTPAGAAEPLDVDVWLVGVEATGEALRTQITTWQDAGSAPLVPHRGRLAAALVGEVILPDGGRLPVDGRSAAEGLPWTIADPSGAARVEVVLARVERLLAEAAALVDLLSRQTGDPGYDPRDALRAEFAAGQYRIPEALAAGDRSRETFVEQLVALFKRIFDDERQSKQGVLPVPAPGGGHRLMVAFTAVATMVLLVLLSTQAPGIARRRRAARTQPPTSNEPAAIDARSRAPAAWRHDAGALAMRGRFGDAIRAEFLAVLAALDHGREIDYRPDRTNGEHLRGFRGPDGRRRRFGEATALFDAVAYGAHEASAEDWDALLGATEELFQVGGADD